MRAGIRTLLLLLAAVIAGGGWVYQNIGGVDHRNVDLSMYLVGVGEYQTELAGEMAEIVLENDGLQAESYRWGLTWDNTQVAAGEVQVPASGSTTLRLSVPGSAGWAVFSVDGSTARLQWRWVGGE
jgi:hypothetical protein